jgi:hypothetical protein
LVEFGFPFVKKGGCLIALGLCLGDVLGSRAGLKLAARTSMSLASGPQSSPIRTWAGFDMAAVRDVDSLHATAARDAERHRARLRVRLRTGSACRTWEQKHERDTEAASYHSDPHAEN